MKEGIQKKARIVRRAEYTEKNRNHQRRGISQGKGANQSSRKGKKPGCAWYKEDDKGNWKKYPWGGGEPKS